jgi:hypothetical protein
MDGFSADPAELDAVAASLAAVARDLTAAGRTLGSCAPDAGASTGETAAALHNLTDGVGAMALRAELQASGLRQTAVSYRSVDAGAGRTFGGG